MTEQNEKLSRTVKDESKRLLDFIRSRVRSEEDAEDILQDVFFELTEAYRLMKPVERMASWLFTVARNKITDWYRKSKTVSLEAQAFAMADEDEKLFLADVLRDEGQGADTTLMRSVIMEEIESALLDLPEAQREVFVMHEMEGKSFAEISLITGTSVKTLLSRKHYAVLFLRKRLLDFYNEMFNR